MLVVRIFSILLLLVSVGWGESRTWTSSDGRPLEGEMLDASEDSVRIRRSDGRVFTVKLTHLSAKDREFVLEQLAEQQAETEAAEKDAARLKGLSEGPYAGAAKNEWVLFPKDKHGVFYQLWMDSKLKRSKEAVPLFIHLHGAAQKSDTVKAGEVDIVVKRLIREEQYEKEPCIVCYPTSPTDRHWGQNVKELESLIDDLVEHLPVDRKRIYLSGYSNGVGGVVGLIDARPNDFAAAMLADGKLPKDDWPGKVVTAFWLHVSKDGELGKIDELKEAFTGAGTPFHVVSMPEIPHNGIAWKMANDPESYDWVFEKSLK